jgi:putative membrane protein
VSLPRVLGGLALVGLAPRIGYAHVVERGPATGYSIWDLAVLGGLAVSGMLYAVGCWRLARRGRQPSGWARSAFWVGWSSLVLAVSPPMDVAVTRWFSVHMAQHELLVLVGAPLVVAGRPLGVWLLALPKGARERAGATLASAPLRTIGRVAARPLVAAGMHGVVIWAWHLPRLYEAAVRSEAIHAVQHATLVGTAVAFWWGVLLGSHGRAAYGASALFVFATSVHTGVLGAIFALSGQPFYRLYAAQSPDAAAAIADQQLAGLYMWIPAGTLLAVVGVALVAAWLAAAGRRASAAGSDGD